MSHDPHDADPRYTPDQVLHDGCAECFERSQHGDRGIGELDALAFAAAWSRAADWGSDQHVGRVSAAEVPLLCALWSVQCQLEKRGIPIGECPGELPGTAINRTLTSAGGDS